jgi:hypothetical protein
MTRFDWACAALDLGALAFFYCWAWWGCYGGPDDDDPHDGEGSR